MIFCRFLGASFKEFGVSKARIVKFISGLVPLIWSPVDEVVVPNDREVYIEGSKSIVEDGNEKHFPETHIPGISMIKYGDEEEKTYKANDSD